MSLATTAMHWGPFRLEAARISDYCEIQQLLYENFRAPSLAEFQLQLEQPGCECEYRLIVRHAHRIVGHARVEFRELRFASTSATLARVVEICTAESFRGQQIAIHLLTACESLAASKGAVALLSRARPSRLFRETGWFECFTPTYEMLRPRALLAEVERRKWEQAQLHVASDDLASALRGQHPLTVRRWKQTEYAAVQRLYDAEAQRRSGLAVRSDAMWRWLIAKHAFDWFYVAIEGPDRTLFDDIQGHIVGYMLIRANRVVELVAVQSDPRAAESLLVRACRDSIEHSDAPMRIDLPAQHALDAIIAAAEGQRLRSMAEDGSKSLCRVLHPAHFLSALVAPMNDTDNEGATRAFSLRFCTLPVDPPEIQRSSGNTLYRVSPKGILSEQSSEIADLTCSIATAARLFSGEITWSLAEGEDRVQVRDRSAAERIKHFLAKLPSVWRPPWDDLA